MKQIMALLIAFIAVYVGVSLIPNSTTTISGITTANGYSTSVVSMVSLALIAFIAMVVFMIFNMMQKGQNTKTLKLWEDFGNRLKLAYTAKFGGENPAFNQEVDSMILQCKTLKKGIGSSAKTSAEMRLKEYAHMCEIPYIIPEEEHLSEVEKTEALKDTTPYTYTDNKHTYTDNKKGTNY